MDISYEYAVTVRNKFDALQAISETYTPNTKTVSIPILKQQQNAYQQPYIKFYGRY